MDPLRNVGHIQGVQQEPVRPVKPVVQAGHNEAHGADAHEEQVMNGSEHAGADREQAQQVANLLNNLAPDDQKMRFVVRDPSKTGAHNVIIEIRQGDKVVATIPSKEVLEMAERVAQGALDDLRGSIVSQHG